MIRKRCPPLCCLVALLCGATASATSVRSLSFDEIAAQADVIVLVETASVRFDWQTSPQGKHIVTIVTFKVERTLKGQMGQELRLEFLGGNIGGLVMDVDGMPQFQVGDRDVLFLSPTRNSVSPIVGLFQGRFRVGGDGAAGTEQMLTYNRQAFVAAAASVSRLRSTLWPSPARPLSYSQFESLVLQTLAQGASK